MKMYKCRFPACNNLIEKSGYCFKHKKFEPKRPMFANSIRTNTKLYNTTKWRKLRQRKIEEQPYCEKCGATENLEVHHIITPKGNELLFYEYGNLQVLCKKCHLKETLEEIKTGKKINQYGIV